MLNQLKNLTVTPPTMAQVIAVLFPFLADLRNYTRQKFRFDIISALTVAVVALPQSMAYAVIAGVHPKYGLYAATVPVVIASLWGSSRFLIAGPTNAIAMLIFAFLAHAHIDGQTLLSQPDEVRMGFVFGVAIIAGLIQLVMGIARLGQLVQFISHSVMVGFTAGAAILIAGGQFTNLLGLNFPKPPAFIAQMILVVEHIPDANWYCLAVGLSTIALIIAIKRFNKALPAPLLSLTIVSIITYLFGLDAHGVSLAGDIPRGLPSFSLPTKFNPHNIHIMFMPAFAIAMLGAVEALSVAKTLAGEKGDRLDGNQEFIAQGLSNIVAGFTSGIAGSGSFTRSAVNFNTDAQTRFSGAMAGVLTLVAILAFGPLASHIPIASLGGVLCVIAWGMINWKGIHTAMVATHVDRISLIVTFLATIFLDLEKAVFIGMFLSLALFLRAIAKPHVTPQDPHEPMPVLKSPLGPWCDKLMIYNVEGPLFSGAIDTFEDLLYKLIKYEHEVIILDLAKVTLIGASGIEALERLHRKCEEHHVSLVLSGCNESVHGALGRVGFLDELGLDNCHHTTVDAMDYCYGYSLDRDQAHNAGVQYPLQKALHSRK